MEQSIEKRVADAILGRSTVTLEIDGKEYPIAPPTVATIILASELIAELPDINMEGNSLIYEVMRSAKDCRVIGKIAATLILGAKRIQENRKVAVSKPTPEKRSYFRRILRLAPRKRENEQLVAEVDYLAQIVLNECSPSTLQAVISQRLLDNEIGDFFGLTTFLKEKNLLAPTGEVEATASGQ